MTRHFHLSVQSRMFLKRHKDLLLHLSIYYLLYGLLNEQLAHLQLTIRVT
jgi:hypothetical protein